MDVKEAVRKAVTYVGDVFGSENPENIGLEEVVLNEAQDAWEITVGFSRPWDYHKPSFVTGFQPPSPKRQYKIVTIDNVSGNIKSIKIRELQNA
jgi:hypothetical protein